MFLTKLLFQNHSELYTLGITLGSVKSRTGYNFIKEEIHVNSNGIQATAKPHRNTKKPRNTSQSLFTTSDSTSDEENVKPIIIPPSVSIQSLTSNLPPSSPISIKIENVQENTGIFFFITY